jgi:hypothetical protein
MWLSKSAASPEQKSGGTSILAAKAKHTGTDILKREREMEKELLFVGSP